MEADRENMERWRSAQTKEDEFWQRNGVIIDQMERVKNRYGPVIKKLSKQINDVVNILDIGCGPTCSARYFTKGIKTFLDPLMNSYIRTYADSLPDGNKICGVGENLPFRDESYDLIMSVNALDHMIDPHVVLSEINRVLKTDGIFVIGNFLHPPRIAAIRCFIEKWLPVFREDAHPYSYTIKSIRELLEYDFNIAEEIRVFRKDSALFPSLHREDWMFICKKKNDKD